MIKLIEPVNAEKARKCIKALILAALFLNGGGVFPQTELPLRRIALFSSGVAYFEHAGTVNGGDAVSFPFALSAVNDALKSLVINDDGRGAPPSVSYPSEETLEATLRSLGIDLSDAPGTAEIFAAQRGAEIEISAPNPITGRIVGVEYRPQLPAYNETGREAYLSLYTGGGFRLVALKDIVTFSFKDPSLNADLARALDLIAENRTSRVRNLTVRFAGAAGSRAVTVSYVIPAPVWKVSYRLDLDRKQPLMQGWAIVDNDSDTDWAGVELSLVSGRPVSFIQNLYPPYYLARPTLPLAIAGTAEARTHEAGFAQAGVRERSAESAMFAAEKYADAEYDYARAPSPVSPANVAPLQTSASGAAAGDQFSYRINTPVNLSRRQSAMIPLVQGNVQGEKTLILDGSRAGVFNPELGVELVNTTGMKLPAGPVTVYDGGSYAGDALIEFFAEGDKRLISYGEDLAVTASAAAASSRVIAAVTVSQGVMTFKRRHITEKTYTIKNAGSEAKRITIEHPITANAELAEPKDFAEKTSTRYRYVRSLPARGELSFTVKEESPLSETVSLSSLRRDSLLAYSADREIPAGVRQALARAAALKQKAEEERAALSALETGKQRLVSEQDRIRNNLGAVGTSSDLGKEYLRRMTELDAQIQKINGDIEKSTAQAAAAQKDLDAYLAGLKL
ncbi:MAG: DUF4139 domain-containing protein [Treponema sp.]|jgi:hypothetical protein|nr:DUF4139 domain-containing protein [Treponema sp.]